jgi:hypothetical protein
VLVNPAMQDRDFTLVVIGAACELISSRVVFDELDRLDSLIANHDVDVVDKEEAAREPHRAQRQAQQQGRIGTLAEDQARTARGYKLIRRS